MNILAKITTHKRIEIAARKKLIPIQVLERSHLFNTPTLSMTKTLIHKESSGVIAEFKRKSPSKGIINPSANISEVTLCYAEAGACALSVLTDTDFFGGTNEDLVQARAVNSCPILRKEFILDPYQIIEAKSIGADAILLIAAILTPEETVNLATLARSLGMETILEIHEEKEITHLNDKISILGVNNRNLTDFSVSLDISLFLSKYINDSIPAISESGIHNPGDVHMLKQAGYKGFLIGEQFMASADPGPACRSFIAGINRRTF